MSLKDMMSKSDFYHFGTLPSMCIHSLDEDEYSKMYKAQDKCEACGNGEWVEGTMQIVKNAFYPSKRVHRCSKCSEVRMARHIGYKD